MSTNYYLRHNVCSCCKRYDEAHIGQYSMGYKFLFQYLPDYATSVKEWKNHINLLNNKIVDEYGEEISIPDFWKIVDEAQNDRSRMGLFINRDYVDNEGYEFLDTDFR